MAIREEARAQLAFCCGVLLGHVNERQRRLLLATEARLLGHGGVRAVAGIAGVSETTVRRAWLNWTQVWAGFPRAGFARRVVVASGSRRMTRR
jgi:hypothetical protein